MFQNPYLHAAIGGALAGLLVDLRAWGKSDAGDYNVKAALIHAIIGAAAGLLTQMGFPA